MTSILRTPDERFQNLPDFPFEPHYLTVQGLRWHYLDEGAGNPVLCLHGEPSWSFLYRKMIPILASHHRVLAPDFIGFGRSDKLPAIEDYTFQLHADTLANFIQQLNLQHITVVVQDWGGMLGLHAAATMPDRFDRLVIMNTGLPTGDRAMGTAFVKWVNFVKRMDKLPIGRVIKMGLANPSGVSDEIKAAYEAPFPDESYQAGAKAFPLLVPTEPNMEAFEPMRQTRRALEKWQKPALIMFSDSDPITKGGDIFFRHLLPASCLQPNITIQGAGHFLQEEKGEEIAQHILDFINAT